MPAPGMICRFALRIGERNPISDCSLSISEDLHDGLAVHVALGSGQVDVPSPCEAMRISIEAEGPGDRSTEILAWCSGAVVETNGRDRGLQLVGVDPLRLCGPHAQFRTHPGQAPLDRVAARVLDQHLGNLQPAVEFGSSSPTIPLDLLLQCQESAGAFVTRVGALVGHVFYWDRDRYACAQMGAVPGTHPPSIDLRPQEGLVQVRAASHFAVSPGQFIWTDPAKQARRILRSEGARGNRRAGGLSSRVAGTVEPPPAILEAMEARDRGTEVEVEACEPQARLGSRISLPETWNISQDDPLRIERIEHYVNERGSYLTRLYAVPESRWAMGRHVQANHLVGPFAALVSHNADPLNQGRVRVRLLEDPEQRSTPWITRLMPAAGEETGFHWVPEVDHTVLVAAEAASPETLYVLGAVRGEAGKIPPDWARNDNSLKGACARNGIRILLDDGKGILRLEAHDSCLELSADGTVRLEGKNLDLAMQAQASIVGRQRVVVDGSRIDLGG